MIIDMLLNLEIYWSQRMSPEDREKLKHFKRIGVKEHVPKDLATAIQTFLTQAIIIGEYELDAMPPEYMENLLKVMSKYPEYNKVTLDLIEILKKGDIIE